MKDFLDKYICGGPGGYYYQIKLIWGRELSGGMFTYKSDAKNHLINALVNFLDNPSAVLHTKSKPQKVNIELPAGLTLNAELPKK